MHYPQAQFAFRRVSHEARNHTSSAMIGGALLDVDGTLLDSNEAHARSWVEAFEGVGVSLSTERVRRRIGKGGDKLLWELLGIEEGSREGQILRAHRLEIF